MREEDHKLPSVNTIVIHIIILKQLFETATKYPRTVLEHWNSGPNH